MGFVPGETRKVPCARFATPGIERMNSRRPDFREGIQAAAETFP